MIMPHTELVSFVVRFLEEYPFGYLIAILVCFSFILSFLWVAIGYIVYYLTEIGGSKDC